MSLESAIAELRADVGDDVLPLVLGQSIEEFGRRREQLAGALEKQELDAVASTAHAIKSVARSLGLDELADIANQAELSAKQGSEHVVAQVLQIQELLSEACEVISAIGIP